MTKYTEINGIHFETIKSRFTPDYIRRKQNSHYQSLYDCYDRPSKSKINIYEFWRNWYLNTDCVESFSVDTYNTFAFSLDMLYFDYDTGEIKGYIKITSRHNYLYTWGD